MEGVGGGTFSKGRETRDRAEALGAGGVGRGCMGEDMIGGKEGGERGRKARCETDRRCQDAVHSATSSSL